MSRSIPSSPRTSFVVISLITWVVSARAQVEQANATSQGWRPWSEWSPCSSSCEVELSQRTRSCDPSPSSVSDSDASSRLCKGTEKQYKVCDKQKCIGSTKDYRKEECDKQVHVPFRGRRYHWDSYIDPRDQCHLTCKARRYGFTISLGRPVKNGVPCDGDSPGSLCLYGRCQTVGCDGVVGSSARQDHCGVCGGDNDSCRIIAGIFTRRHLKYGYNPITKIPRGSCHVNITELARSRNYLVLKYSNGTSIINADRNNMKHPGTYYAAGTTFRYGKMEGAQCPGECLYAEGPLTDQIDIELLSYRHNEGIKYMFTIPKSMIESVMQTFQTNSGTQGRRRGNTRGQQTTNATDDRISFNQQPEYISPDSPGRDAYGYQALQGKQGKLSTQEAINRYREGYKKGQDESPSINTIDSDTYRGTVPLGTLGTGTSYDRRTNYIDSVPLARPLQPTFREAGTSSSTATGRGSAQTYNRQGTGFIPATSGGSAPIYNRQGTGSSTSGSSGSQTYNRQYPVQGGVNYNTYDRRIVSNQRQELIVPDTLDEINFHWTISGFTECSRTCGGGRQDTILTCMKRKTNVQVTDENCDPAKKNVQTIVCNKSPCPPDWEEGPWSLCSVTCGQGLQTRRVECNQRYSENVSIPVSAQQCDLTGRPPTSQSCQNKPCADWQASNWTKCSVDCGIGEMSRSVDCVDTEGRRVPEQQCAGIKPGRSQRCDMGTCAKGWFQTAWSESCSTECGRGYHTRTVYCSAEDGSALPEHKCGEKPRTEKQCKKTRPCGGFWFEGPWSRCTATCGEEVQKRDVVCMKKLDSDMFKVVGEGNCKEIVKPESEKPCPSQPACPPKWYMTKWSECSKSCGIGVKTRDAKCLDTDKAPSSSCRYQDKPPLRRSCNTQDCDLPQLDEDSGCKDHWHQCHLVVQARLCPYKYYKDKCCHACALHHLKHKQDKQAQQS